MRVQLILCDPADTPSLPRSHWTCSGQVYSDIFSDRSAYFYPSSGWGEKNILRKTANSLHSVDLIDTNSCFICLEIEIDMRPDTLVSMESCGFAFSRLTDWLTNAHKHTHTHEYWEIYRETRMNSSTVEILNLVKTDRHMRNTIFSSHLGVAVVRQTVWSVSVSELVSPRVQDLWFMRESHSRQHT